MKQLLFNAFFIVFTVSSCFADGQPQTQSAQSNQEGMPAPVFDTQTKTASAGKISNIKYLSVKNFNVPYTITLSDINDFSTLITDHKINHVFYNSTMFFVQSDMLPIPVTITSNGYKSIFDYQIGNDIGFKNGASYYYAIDNKLKTQDEVDYYKSERFFSPEDYRLAQKDGFVKSGSSSRFQRITGIIKKSDLEKNIYFANAIIYLLFFQQTDLVKSFLENKDVVSLTLPFTRNPNVGRNYYSSSSNNTFVEFKTGYYYINIDISGLDTSKDAVFYYASKFAQYTNYADFQARYSANNQYTIKNSETIAKNELKYNSYQECVNDINSMLNAGKNN